MIVVKHAGAKVKTRYWYAGRFNEIFLDIDSPLQLRRALRVLRLALKTKTRRASFQRQLDVVAVYLYPSATLGHVHLIIVLSLPADDIGTKVSWALWMGGDPLRAAYALQRAAYGLENRELLVSERYPLYPGRQADAVCYCKEKHKAELVTRKCPALRALLGDHAAADYFPRVRDERRKLGPLVLPWGRLSKRQIEKWEAPRWTVRKLTSI